MGRRNGGAGLFAFLIILDGLPRTAEAQIAWGSADEHSCDSDVSMLGTSVYAYDWDDVYGSATFSGVNFIGATGSTSDGNVAIGSGAVNYSGAATR